MRKQLEQRIAELRAEFDAGQKMLAELEQKRDSLQQTLLRISGAIQVLGELLADDQPSPNGVQASSPAPVPASDNEHL